VETGEVQEGEPMPMEGEQSEPVEQFGLNNEFKTVHGVQAPIEPESEPEPQPQGEPVEDDVLFGDAPEQRTKKLAYN
jgi:hypothetical protein